MATVSISAASSRFTVAAHRGDVVQMRQLLSEASIARQTLQGVFHMLCERGNVDGVTLLLPLVKPSASNSQGLVSAAGIGHMGLIELLLPLSQPQVNHSMPMRAAVQAWHVHAVEKLLPHARPGDANQAYIDLCSLNTRKPPPDAVPRLHHVMRLLVPHLDIGALVDWLGARDKVSEMALLDDTVVAVLQAQSDAEWVRKLDGLEGMLPKACCWWQAQELESALPSAAPSPKAVRL